MKSLDTNIVLRLLLNDVPAHTARAKTLIGQPPIYVSDVVVAEAAFVLEKAIEMNRAQVAILLRLLLSLPGLIYNDHILHDVVDFYESKRSLSFVDCYAAVEAKAFGAKLYTFDRKLVNQGGAHVEAA